MDICRIFAEAGAEYKDDRQTERPEAEDKQAVLTLSVDIDQSIDRVGRYIGRSVARLDDRSIHRSIEASGNHWKGQSNSRALHQSVDRRVVADDQKSEQSMLLQRGKRQSC